MDSHIAYGSPNKQDTSSAHGEPLGEEEIRLTKAAYGWPEDAKLRIPPGVEDHFRDGIGARGASTRDGGMARFDSYEKKHPELADQLYRMQHRQLPEGWDAALESFPEDPKGIAGRAASAKVLNAVAQNVPWLISGSADLTPSTKTRLEFSGAGDLTPDEPGGRNLHFGVREHAMGSILNGLRILAVNF